MGICGCYSKVQNNVIKCDFQVPNNYNLIVIKSDRNNRCRNQMNSNRKEINNQKNNHNTKVDLKEEKNYKKEYETNNSIGKNNEKLILSQNKNTNNENNKSENNENMDNNNNQNKENNDNNKKESNNNIENNDNNNNEKNDNNENNENNDNNNNEINEKNDKNENNDDNENNENNDKNENNDNNNNENSNNNVNNINKKKEEEEEDNMSKKTSERSNYSELKSDRIDSDLRNFTPEEVIKEEIFSLGINIGAHKTVFSIFSRINQKYVSNVLLMNNSSRIIPSIICYTKDHRLIGDNSISSLKQHLSTSYNNLSRIIGYDKDIKIYEKEILFGFDGISNLNEEKSYYYNSTEKKKIKSEVIISDFLGLLKKYYIKKEKYYYTSTYISVPDFFSSYQKEELRLICKSLLLMDVNIFNESSAITMYYGYTKYRDNFVIGKNKVDTTIIKNILFIDIGHSKSSFILSTFHYSKFKINYVLTLPFIGGRNFDELIINYCIEYFKKKKNFNDLEVTSKMKYRLLESVRKARIQLTVNTEASILVDVFYNEEDLELVLEKVKFEELINDCVKEIDNTLKEVINYSKKNNIIIDCVEIAGELMRTPILQKIIENKGLKICKSLLIDECASVGSAILGNYKLGKLPIANFKKFYHYNYYSIDYEIIQNDQVQEKNNLLNIGIVQDTEVKIKIKKDYIIQDKPIYIKIFYNDGDNNNVKLTTNNLILIEYEIDLFKMLNGNKIEDDIFFKMEIDSCQKLLNEEIIFNDQKFKNNINIIKGGIYKTYGKENQFKKQIMKSYSSHKLFDSNYHLIVEKKNQMSKSLYSLKSIVEKNPELKEDLNKIQVLDKKIHNIKAPYDKNSLEQIQKEIEDLKKYINDKEKDI